VIVRRERPADVGAVQELTRAAFGRPAAPEPVEPGLLAELRADAGWIGALSLVAEAGGVPVGHVVCTRGWIGDAAGLGLGPIAVAPEHQGRGVGSALMHAVLGAAEALGEPVVVLLGDPRFYARFGFVPAAALGITPPVAEWAPAFQARPLADRAPRGAFRYAEPFQRIPEEAT
jgi:putative acetyltransferase